MKCEKLVFLNKPFVLGVTVYLCQRDLNYRAQAIISTYCGLHNLAKIVHTVACFRFASKCLLLPYDKQVVRWITRKEY